MPLSFLDESIQVAQLLLEGDKVIKHLLGSTSRSQYFIGVFFFFDDTWSMLTVVCAAHCGECGVCSETLNTH